ncbi:hypothetical protein BDD14_1095 [Edaphobacter modestus]|uniref:Uncharacterized protein n=1 Tax=Edaphobacter modestus TaxID=388466 RepID=A0A4V2G460_9BACT|nr:hypothetical protein BDD14_1095 [Edaphobacter modestus]
MLARFVWQQRRLRHEPGRPNLDCRCTLRQASMKCRVYSSHTDRKETMKLTARRISLRKEGRWCGQLSAMLLILSLLLPFAGAIFHSHRSEQTLIPVCCRAHGKHRCLMRAMERMESPHGSSSFSPHLAQLFEKCPYMPAAISAAQGSSLCHCDEKQHRIRWQIDSLSSSLHRADPDFSPQRTHGKRGPPPSSYLA